MKEVLDTKEQSVRDNNYTLSALRANKNVVIGNILHCTKRAKTKPEQVNGHYYLLLVSVFFSISSSKYNNCNGQQLCSAMADDEESATQQASTKQNILN